MATYTVHKSYIEILGRIWMPPVVAAYVYNLSEYDAKIIEEFITRDEVELWLCKNAGDFQEIIDFRADIYARDINEDIVFEWSDPESEYTFNDLMYPSDD